MATSLLSQVRVATDEVAYSHLFMTAAGSGPGVEAETASAMAERRLSYAKHIGLNPKQASLLIEIANRYRDGLEGISARARPIAGLPTSAVSLDSNQRLSLRELSRDRHEMLVSLIHELRSRLDEQGNRIVTTYIEERVKPNITFE